jgi:hypothetical protein
MTQKSNFTAEEWTQLLQAPGAAGIYVIMSDPSFIVGSMKEAFAISWGIIKKAGFSALAAQESAKMKPLLYKRLPVILASMFSYT